MRCQGFSERPGKKGGDLWLSILISIMDRMAKRSGNPMECVFCTVPSDFCLFDVVQWEFYGDTCQNHSNLQWDDKIDRIDISFSL